MAALGFTAPAEKVPFLHPFANTGAPRGNLVQKVEKQKTQTKKTNYFVAKCATLAVRSPLPNKISNDFFFFFLAQIVSPFFLLSPPPGVTRGSLPSAATEHGVIIDYNKKKWTHYLK